MKSLYYNRRQFVGRAVASSGLTALGASRVSGANDKISIGLIGCGGRMRTMLRELVPFAKESNAAIVAVCDVWRQQREEIGTAMSNAFGGQARQIVHYEELLAMRDIDAVVIAAPDHQHCRILAAAVRAGKDAYIEKPLAMEMDDLIRAVDAVKQSRRVVQCGTQIRSFPHSVAARDFVKAGGLGKILKVEQGRNHYQPYWYQRGARKVAEADVAWKAFLMHRRYRPWNAQVFTGWYGYREFSRGPHTGLGAHFFDLVHFVTGAQYPVRVTATGGTYHWKDKGYDAPDSIEVMLEYPEGFLVRYSTVFGTTAGSYLKFLGTRGTIDATRWSWTEPWGLSGEGSGERDRVPEGAKLPQAASVPHLQNWLDCIRSRKDPAAPIDSGYAHAVAAIMADEAYLRGKRMVYDHAKRAIREG